jgi:hypothetical protein
MDELPVECERDRSLGAFDLETRVVETEAECTITDEGTSVHEVVVTSHKLITVYMDIQTESGDGCVEYLESGEPTNSREGQEIEAADVGDPTTRVFRFAVRRCDDGPRERSETLSTDVICYRKANADVEDRNEIVRRMVIDVLVS